VEEMEPHFNMKRRLQKWHLTLLSRWSSVLSGANGRGYTNALYGIADYLAQPVGMIISAPFLLKQLGLAQYGVWVLASAAVTSGSLVSAGFGDAAIKHIAMFRRRNDRRGVEMIVRNMVAINLILSGILALVLWSLAPYISRHAATSNVELQMACVKSLRIGSGLLITKSVESVFVSALRAFETYGPAVRIAVYSRTAIIASATVLAWMNHGVVMIMTITFFIVSCSLVAQGYALKAKAGNILLIPIWHTKTVSTIAGLGIFSWLQAIAGIAFSQADRLLIGLFLGATSVASYGLCVQIAQPIHGLIASGMHFLFPHLSGRYTNAQATELRSTVLTAFRINAMLVILLSLTMFIFSKVIVKVWLGPIFDYQSNNILPIITCSYALLGLNITAYYTLLALGGFKTATFLNLVAGGAMLFAMTVLASKHGLQGASAARLVYGPITCLMYLRLAKMMQHAIPVITSPRFPSSNMAFDRRRQSIYR
jgi:O-antigen/teichoic acid export membrane protein